MKTPAAVYGEHWDLTNCDREPIHIPGSIQPHGCLIAAHADTREIRIVSENVESILGLDAKSLVGKNLDDVFADESILSQLRGRKFDELVSASPFRLRFTFSNRASDFRAIAFESGEHFVFELEPFSEESEGSHFYHNSRSAVSALQASTSLSELYQAAVTEVRRLTNFDRVTIYKFDEAWNGHVLAEAKGSKGDSYFDLHFPASDIPKQARELYKLNRIRIIPDVNYKSASLVGAPDAPALDLSKSALRSISPIHIEYLRNMPATASMSISLTVHEQLWGLISCTHMSGPLNLSFETRAISELIGQFVSALLPLRDAEEARVRAVSALEKQSQLLSAMSNDDDFAVGLMRERSEFLKTVAASGGAIYSRGDYRVVGQAPDPQALVEITRWLDSLPKSEIYQTESLPEHLPQIANLKETACGLLAFPVSSAQSSYVMWFRPEVSQTVTWGGDPRKPVVITNGQAQLHPRKSFEAWKEVVQNKSLPWTKDDISAALLLRKGILEVVMKKLERISLLNRELERSNTELDSFAYAASHDLKEPLRGITNYAGLLSRSLKSVVTKEDSSRFGTIMRLTERMEDLINSLLDYSQIGRAEMMVRTTDMNEVVRAAIDSLRTRVEESHGSVEIESELPPANCDRAQATAVFTNLISNAIKYNNSSKKEVRIGFKVEKGEPVYFVRDNGIGIETDNQKTIFQIFKRLHGKDEFGGGTGTGLTIAKKIIERHGGHLWLESSPGQGSTFFFNFGNS